MALLIENRRPRLLKVKKNLHQRLGKLFFILENGQKTKQQDLGKCSITLMYFLCKKSTVSLVVREEALLW